MKKYVIILVLLINNNFIYSQEYYDLIIKPDGDSIFCHIDSISGSQIYFKIKYENRWIQTHIEKSIVEYKQNAFEKKYIRLYADNSFEIIPDKSSEIKTLKVKNNITVGILGNAAFWSVNYERLLYEKNSNHGIKIGLGVGFAGEESHGILNDEQEDFYLTIPITFTYNHILKEGCHFNLGMGFTLMNGNVTQHYYFYPIIGLRFYRINKNNNRYNFGPYLSYPIFQEVRDIAFFIPIGFYFGYSF